MFKKVFTYLLAVFLVAGLVSVGDAQKLPKNRKEDGGKLQWIKSGSTTATLTGVASTADTSAAFYVWEMDGYNLSVNTTNVSNGETVTINYQLSTDGVAWTTGAYLDSALVAGTDYNLAAGVAGATATLALADSLNHYRLMRLLVNQTLNAANTDSVSVVIKPFVYFKDVQEDIGGHKLQWQGSESNTLTLTGIANSADTSSAIYVWLADNLNFGINTTNISNGEGVVLDYQLSVDGITWKTASLLDSLNTSGTDYNIAAGRPANTVLGTVPTAATLGSHRLLRLTARQVISAADTDTTRIVVKPFVLFKE